MSHKKVNKTCRFRKNRQTNKNIVRAIESVVHSPVIALAHD